jgi:hypothetical protein
MMLMLYAIPARQNEISEVVGSERYEKMHSIVNAEFQKWYDNLTNTTETIQQSDGEATSETAPSAAPEAPHP